jgi:predicted XRE-type DNA-binding protein
MNEADDAITRGTGNVFADLGYADAEERQTKLRLAHAINGVIARRRLTQAAAAEKLGINQPKVSALANYKLDGFSVERLMTFLTALDQDVEIIIRKKPRSWAIARISVVLPDVRLTGKGRATVAAQSLGDRASGRVGSARVLKRALGVAANVRRPPQRAEGISSRSSASL